LRSNKIYARAQIAFAIWADGVSREGDAVRTTMVELGMLQWQPSCVFSFVLDDFQFQREAGVNNGQKT